MATSLPFFLPANLPIHNSLLFQIHNLFLTNGCYMNIYILIYISKYITRIYFLRNNYALWDFIDINLFTHNIL